MREVVQNLRGLSADLRVTADNLNAITGQVKSGEGTMGKLFYSDEAHDRLTSALTSVEGGVKSLQETLGRANRIQMDLGIKADYYAGPRATAKSTACRRVGRATRASAVGLRLVPNPERNRFYNIELADDPRGKRARQDARRDAHESRPPGESTTIVTETTQVTSATS